MRWSILLAVIAAAAVVAVPLRQGRSAPDVPKASVEYKVIPASELGMTGVPGNGVFDYKGATDKLNDLAREGWRFRALLTAAGPAGVLLERQR